MKVSRNIIILGTGGNCVDTLEMINDINSCGKVPKYKCIGFLDDDKSLWGKEIAGVKVLGPIESSVEYVDSFFINGIGSPSNFWKKESIISKADIPSERFATIIHPSALVSSSAHIGYGVSLFQNVVIMSNVRIGNHVRVLPNSVINHDVIIGGYSSITSSVSIGGNVCIGKSCYLGTNCSIIGKVTIGDYCLIGMGSVVLDNILDNQIVVGNPARFLRFINTA